MNTLRICETCNAFALEDREYEPANHRVWVTLLSDPAHMDRKRR